MGSSPKETVSKSLFLFIILEKFGLTKLKKIHSIKKDRFWDFSTFNQSFYVKIPE